MTGGYRIALGADDVEGAGGATSVRSGGALRAN